jgi:hypothetical protein
VIGRQRLGVLLVTAALSVLGIGMPLAPADAAKPASFQAGLWPYAKLDIAAAQRQSTGTGVSIGVIDGPVDPTVPELRGQHVITQAKGYCRAADGSYPGRATGETASHATAITSLMVGNGTGTFHGRGVRGIAPGATVRSYVIGLDTGAHHKFDCQSASGSVDYQTSLAIKQAVRDGVKIINLSIGGDVFGGSTPFAIGEAEKAGVIVVVATDDSQTPGVVGEPGATNGVITVNAVDSAGVLARSSAGGGGVSIAAPGVGLTTGGFYPRWQSDASGDGSSYAAPVVCASLALVWSKYPHASANQVVQDLLANTGLLVGKDAAGKPTYTNGFRRDPNAPAGYQQNNGYGYGIVNPVAMLAHDPSLYPAVNPLVRANGTPAPAMLGASVPATGSASASPSATTATATASTSTSASASASATGGGAASSTPAGGSGSSAAGSGSGGVPGGLLAGAAALVALGAAAAMLMLRRRSTAQRAPNRPQPHVP